MRLGIPPSKAKTEGEVCYQSISQGTKVEKDSIVIIVVYSQENEATIPYVVGMKREEATGLLQAIGMNVTFKTVTQYGKEADTVVSQSSGAGIAVNGNLSIELKIAAGGSRSTETKTTTKATTAANNVTERTTEYNPQDDQWSEYTGPTYQSDPSLSLDYYSYRIKRGDGFTLNAAATGVPYNGSEAFEISYNEDGLFIAEYICHISTPVRYVDSLVYRYYETDTSVMESTKRYFNPKVLTSFASLVLMYQCIAKDAELDTELLRIAKDGIINRYLMIRGQMEQHNAVDKVVLKDFRHQCVQECGILFVVGYMIRRAKRRITNLIKRKLKI